MPGVPEDLFQRQLLLFQAVGVIVHRAERGERNLQLLGDDGLTRHGHSDEVGELCNHCDLRHWFETGAYGLQVDSAVNAIKVTVAGRFQPFPPDLRAQNRYDMRRLFPDDRRSRP